MTRGEFLGVFHPRILLQSGRQVLATTVWCYFVREWYLAHIPLYELVAH